MCKLPGVVYRATTTDGNIVAVKKLTLPSSYSKEDSGLGGNVFEAQVERLSQLKHFNIVSILAHCSSKEVHLMLYEYMPNCSLGDVLHKHKPALQWNTRYCIALGTAEGLAYLHHTCVPSVVHGNLKSNNILLDTNLEPHIADFGLAKLLDWTFDWTSIAKIEGECGYIAPGSSWLLSNLCQRSHLSSQKLLDNLCLKK
jgi:serine/threonine protein kinase